MESPDDAAQPADAVLEVLGVYDADGGLRGELAYAVGKVLGRTHCSLCDITHSPYRRKPAWDRMADRLGVPVRLAHRNELAPEEQAVAAALPLPLVLGRTAGGRRLVLLTSEQLDALGGSVDEFDRALRAALAGLGS